MFHNRTFKVLSSFFLLVVFCAGQVAAAPNNSTNKVRRNTSAGSWTMTTAMNETRSGHTATLLPNGKVLVAGGQGTNGYRASAELYDPTTGLWTATGSMNIARPDGHTATLLANGKVLVVGGYDGDDHLGRLDISELYDPATGQWTTTGTTNEHRNRYTATLLPNGNVLVTGGYYWSGSSYIFLDSAELYNPTTGQWTITGAMNGSRDSHTATLLSNGKVLVAGGGQAYGNTQLASAELYDPATGQWTATGTMHEPRLNNTAMLLPTGKVLVSGGYGNENHLTSAELYDPTTGLWTITGSMSSTHSDQFATLLSNGKVLVAGGMNVTTVIAELYDDVTGQWTITGSMKIARIGHTATLLPNNKVLVAGGFGGGYLASAELYDPDAIDPDTYTISGSVGTDGVILSYTDVAPKTVVSNNNGDYSISVPVGWSGTITPAKSNHIFSPLSHSYTNVQSNQVNQNFSYGNVDMELIGLEVTQVIQDLNNSVVLIQDKPTFVRAHVQSMSGTVNDVTALLIGKRNGIELPGSPLVSANNGGNVDVKENADSHRSVLEDSFYFRLPASWRSGTVEFEFQGNNHAISCKEHANLDNDCKATVTFQQTAPLDVRIVGAVWNESNGTSHAPTSAEISELARAIEATYPIPYLQWDNPYYFEYILDDFVQDPLILNARLAEQRVLDGCVTVAGFGCQRIYVGVIVDPPTGTSLYGLGGFPPNVASGFWIGTDKYKGILPHEIGHVLGRLHTPSCKAVSFPWWHYPYADGHISQEDSGDNAFYGFSAATKAVYGPTTGDLMSYCFPVWPSDWTYNGLRDEISSRFGSLSATTEAMSLTSSDSLLISGRITPTQNIGQIDSIYQFSASSTLPVHTSGSYILRLEDSSSNVLANYPFEPEVVAQCPPYCSENEQVSAFTLAIPFNPQVSRILLLHGQEVLVSRMASANTPQVSVSYPNGGEFLSGSTETLSWSANDVDGDMLEYAVQYSTDGGTTWQTLVSSWVSTTYKLELGALAGTDQGIVRVLASDGFHTSQDQSDGTFSVVKHPPQASIQSPESNSLYVGDQTIILEGKGYDNEDGQLEDAFISWTSNLDGALGSGQSLAVVASSLSEGTHTITLTVQDSEGQTGLANITIDVYSERPTLPISLSITPYGLNFTAFRNSGQTLGKAISIRNGGDGTMTWSATTDQNWIQLSSLEGTAPTDFVVVANPAGLSIGEYVGNINISASGANNSPRIIPVMLQIQEPLQEPPVINSITLANPDMTNLTNVGFTVTFSEPVTGVDTDDFKLTNTILTGASITSVSGADDIYNVMVNTGTGNGAIRLDVRETASIQDLDGNDFAGPYTGGQIYTINKGFAPTVPALVSPANGTLVAGYKPTLDWKDSSPVMALANDWSYEVNVTSSYGYNQTFNTESGLSNSSYTFTSSLPVSTTFTWKVRAYNDKNQYSTWSASRTFRTSTKLDTPVLTSPQNAATLDNKRPTFVWEENPAAASYTLQILKDGKVVNTGTIAAPLHTYTPAVDMLPATTYSWRVRANNGVNTGEFSASFTFTTSANPPNIPVLVDPANKVIVSSAMEQVLRWKLDAGSAASYEVEYATDAAFSDSETGTISGTELSLPLGSLLPNRTYYWHVRSWSEADTKGNHSYWSAVRTFRTKLETPVLNLPANGTTLDNKRPTFSWDEVPGATTYTLQVMKDGKVVVTGKIKMPAYTFALVKDLLPSTEYTWRVKANGTNPGDYSVPNTFTTSINPPKAPMPSAPANNALVDSSVAQVFKWGAVLEVVTPASPAAGSYEVEYATNAGFINSSPTVKVNAPVTETAPITLLPGRTYYWRVRSWSGANGTGNHSAWSKARTIKVKFVAPALTSPANGDTNVPVRPTFTWSSANGLWTFYTLQIAPDNTFGKGTRTIKVNAPTTKYTIPDSQPALGAGIQYCWRVKINGLYFPAQSATVNCFTTAP